MCRKKGRVFLVKNWLNIFGRKGYFPLSLSPWTTDEGTINCNDLGGQNQFFVMTRINIFSSQGVWFNYCYKIHSPHSTLSLLGFQYNRALLGPVLWTVHSCSPGRNVLQQGWQTPLPTSAVRSHRCTNGALYPPMLSEWKSLEQTGKTYLLSWGGRCYSAHVTATWILCQGSPHHLIFQ